jgi:hypothetical protein
VDEQGVAGQEVILIARPAAPSPPDAGEALREILVSSVGLATYTVTTVVALVEQAVTAAVSATVGAAMNRAVPLVADAILQRLDLTDLVLDHVDLRRIVESTLDEIDLTALVLERVDIDAIVGAADIEAVIDRVPIVSIADYVIEEIDLPQIIRDSTSGVAGEALDSVRRQGVGADVLLSGLIDRIIRRRERSLAAPGAPESLRTRGVEGDGRAQDHAAQATGTTPEEAADDAAEEAADEAADDAARDRTQGAEERAEAHSS